MPRATGAEGMNREEAPGKSPEDMYIQQKVRVLLMLKKMGSNVSISSWNHKEGFFLISLSPKWFYYQHIIISISYLMNLTSLTPSLMKAGASQNKKLNFLSKTKSCHQHVKTRITQPAAFLGLEIISAHNRMFALPPRHNIKRCFNFANWKLNFVLPLLQ